MSDPVISAALALGFATSFHCAGMCGPLACAVLPTRQDSSLSREAQEILIPSCYHTARLLSYSLIGMVAGSMSFSFADWWNTSPVRWLPWIMVLALILHALGLEKKIPKPLFLSRWWFKLKGRQTGSIWKRAVTIGFFTPLLPCGPLYLFFGVCLMSGSPWKGAALALSFGLGTIPMLWIAQNRWRWLQQKITPPRLDQLKRGLTLAMALFLIWRLQGTLPFLQDSTKPFCPLCEGWEESQDS